MVGITPIFILEEKISSSQMKQFSEHKNCNNNGINYFYPMNKLIVYLGCNNQLTRHEMLKKLCAEYITNDLY